MNGFSMLNFYLVHPGAFFLGLSDNLMVRPLHPIHEYDVLKNRSTVLIAMHLCSKTDFSPISKGKGYVTIITL